MISLYDSPRKVGYLKPKTLKPSPRTQNPKPSRWNLVALSWGERPRVGPLSRAPEGQNVDLGAEYLSPKKGNLLNCIRFI